MKIVKLTRFPVKKEPGISTDNNSPADKKPCLSENEVTLISGYGIEGDAHKSKPAPGAIPQGNGSKGEDPQGKSSQGEVSQGEDSKKQVSLLAADARRWIDIQAATVSGEQNAASENLAATVSGEQNAADGKLAVCALCHKKFKENILIDGLPDNLPRGTSLTIGDAVLTITAKKECFDECDLHVSGAMCRLSQSAAFAAVEKGGVIKVGDEVEVR